MGWAQLASASSLTTVMIVPGYTSQQQYNYHDKDRTLRLDRVKDPQGKYVEIRKGADTTENRKT